jgi:hypothetical protein
MKTSVLCAAVCALALPSCGRAAADSFDATNPIQCGTLFAVTLGLSKNPGDKLDRELKTRKLFAAGEAKKLPPEKRTRKYGEELARWSMVHPDEAANRTISCMKTQDQNPDFRRFVRTN